MSRNQPAFRSSAWCCALIVGAVGMCSGCSMFPESLQPHQLWKMNRGQAHSQDPFFSLKDNEAAPLPTVTAFTSEPDTGIPVVQ